MFKKLFEKKTEKEMTVDPYQKFWSWFQENHQIFFDVVNNRKSPEEVEEKFFNPLAEKLAEIKQGYFFLTGMKDDNTAELILTPDGVVKNIVFVEELINSAPELDNWQFTALKPSASGIENMNLEMAGYTFNKDNLSFVPVEYDGYPDEVNIAIIYDDFNEEDAEQIKNGIFIFLDNYLGELKFVTAIDSVDFITKQETTEDLIPLEKLKDYLIWREKEFIEKYSGTRYDTKDDEYSAYEAELENGMPIIAVMNSTLLRWDSKASHPWMLSINIEFEGNNGMPDSTTYELMDKLEDDLTENLKDFDGYLNVGRETGNNVREIYFACKGFRKLSKIMFELEQKYADKLKVSYEIYKDKYWNTFRRFGVS